MNQQNDNSFLFNVDILVKSTDNGQALQLLLQLLNSHKGEVADYRIMSGIELGKIIEATLAVKRKSILSSPLAKESMNKAPIQEVKKFKASKESPVEEWIQTLISSNRLVRVLIETSKGRHSIPCRILNFIPEESLINVYHVDEKSVYTYKMYEIIDILDA